jgi:hypothetical protein
MHATLSMWKKVNMMGAAEIHGHAHDAAVDAVRILAVAVAVAVARMTAIAIADAAMIEDAPGHAPSDHVLSKMFHSVKQIMNVQLNVHDNIHQRMYNRVECL